MPTDPATVSSEEKIPPVSPDETIMRRILKGKSYKQDAKPPVQMDAFIPRAIDQTGLSVSRRHTAKHPNFLTASQLKSQCRAKTAESSGVVTTAAQDVFDLGLTIQVDSQDEDKGDCLIPEINYPALTDDQNRKRILKWAADLALVASVEIQPG